MLVGEGVSIVKRNSYMMLVAKILVVQGNEISRTSLGRYSMQAENTKKDECLKNPLRELLQLLVRVTAAAQD
ncbi:hypothetical protein Tco_0709693 [Tanacetum coccineum]